MAFEKREKVYATMVATCACVALVTTLVTNTPPELLSKAHIADGTQGTTVAEPPLAGEIGSDQIVSGPVLARPVDQSATNETTPEPANLITASIPAGYRAITVPTDSLTAVEGYARPGADVDVIFIPNTTEKKTAAVITQRAKVLSSARGQSTDLTTLLVPERDAQKIALAQTAGKLALALTGNADSAAESDDVTISMSDLYANNEARPVERSRNANIRPSSGASLGAKLDSRGGAPAPLGRLQDRTKYLSVQPRVAIPEPRGEEYIHVNENGRQRTLDQPVSTFSIDVDTGSYTNVRRYLSKQQLPPRDAVRVEEFLNYFKYDYPVQHEQPFSVSYETGPSPFEPGRHLLKIGVKAKDLIASEKPWNLIFLVDVSGSMAPTGRLDLIRQSLKLLTNRMRAGDRISIVTYAGDSGVRLPPTGVEGRTQILAAIDKLTAAGGTNGGSGLQLAYQVARQGFLEGGVNRVVVATDGDFNVGITDRNELVRMIEEKRRDRISLTVLGVGEANLKEATLEQLADKGNGNYYYLDSFQEARRIFEGQLYGAIENVASDVKLQVEFNPDNVSEYRLIGYENRNLANAQFNNDAVDAGEVGSAQNVTALYEVLLNNGNYTSEDALRYQPRGQPTPSPSPAVRTDELAFVKIRYKGPEGGPSNLLQYPIEKRFVQEDLAKTSNDFRFAAAVSAFAHILKQSDYRPVTGYPAIVELALGAIGSDADGSRREFVNLVRNLNGAEWFKNQNVR